MPTDHGHDGSLADPETGERIDMPLKAFVRDLDDVSEAHRELYAETDDGGFVLDVEGSDGFELARTTGLSTALADTKRKLRQAKAKLSEFDGIDPKLARDALETVDALGEDGKPDTKKLEDALRQRYERKITDLTTELQTAQKTTGELKQRLDSTSIRQAAERHLVASRKVEADKFEGVWPHVRDRLRLVDDEGQVRIVAVDDLGNPLTSKKHPGSEMGHDEYLDGLSEVPYLKPFFSFNGHSGGGTRTPHGVTQRPTQNPWDPKSSATIDDRMALYKRDPALARQLAAEHGVDLPAE